MLYILHTTVYIFLLCSLLMAVPGTFSLPPAPEPFRFPTSTPLPADPVTPAPLGGRGWEAAISGLRQSIWQARQELEETQAHHTTVSAASLKQPFTDW